MRAARACRVRLAALQRDVRLRSLRQTQALIDYEPRRGRALSCQRSITALLYIAALQAEGETMTLP